MTFQDRRAATNRLIASLQPNLLCTIVKEESLEELFYKLKAHSSEELPRFNGGDWFKNSYHILALFQKALRPQNPLDIITYPWQILTHFKEMEEKQNERENNIQAMVELVRSNHNLILTGAPGTGKTYLARQIAKRIIGLQESESLQESERFTLVQFHPSYDYTDFVEGLRPTPPDRNGNIGFERKDGAFKAFCKKALANESLPFVFVIDEINRGEISKIFGELFCCIDPSYRGKEGLIQTQYQNMITDESDPFRKGFYVPDNLYIIGTTNDIDRSVENMDFAMRRRFAWKEIRANEHTDMLNEFGDLKETIVRKMNRLNDAIWNERTDEGIEGLGTAYHIGGAYFMKIGLYLDHERSNEDEAFRKLWENHLRGILHEYLRGSLNAAENLRTLEQIYYSDPTQE